MYDASGPFTVTAEPDRLGIGAGHVVAARTRSGPMSTAAGTRYGGIDVVVSAVGATASDHGSCDSGGEDAAVGPIALVARSWLVTAAARPAAALAALRERLAARESRCRVRVVGGGQAQLSVGPLSVSRPRWRSRRVRAARCWASWGYFAGLR